MWKAELPIHAKRDLGKGLLRQIMRDAELTLDDMMKG
jgi:predicted RNA binding protein YcfA (HicA-like mRNA interferase family)